ncbi:MAG: ABC transporter ATP-binding protein [Roseburia sp.]|nr:ABC transporter ATP-binding protein [Roseburia sp.]
MKTILKVRGVKQCFGKKTVLENVNLEVGEGEILGLLDPSGAGKTTLIKIITGQLAPTEGTVEICGTSGEYKPNRGVVSAEESGKPAVSGREHFCQKIGIMMDNFGLYERLSCYDNLKFYAKLQGIPMKKIEETLKKVGLFQAKKTSAANLSKGMRSRLLLARALLSEPKLLFLDEPTNGLDPATAAEIHKLIREEQEKGTTIFLTTHNMAEAEKLCNHVALLHEGRIVEYGNPGEICRRYHHQKRLLLHLAGGEEVVLPHDKSCAEKLLFYLEEGKLETIHSTEPNLENVFMELTGRRLEE